MFGMNMNMTYIEIVGMNMLVYTNSYTHFTGSTYSSPPGIVFVLLFSPGLLSWLLEYCFIRGSKSTSSPHTHLHPSMYVCDTRCVAIYVLLIVNMHSVLLIKCHYSID